MRCMQTIPCGIFFDTQYDLIAPPNGYLPPPLNITIAPYHWSKSELAETSVGRISMLSATSNHTNTTCPSVNV